VAGVVVDRYDRKRLLVITDIARGITVFGFLLVREPEHIWLLYALTAVQLGLSGFFFPGRNAILPDIVSGLELGAANALSSATWSTMLALGAALGGFAAGSWGIYPSFVVDGFTFFLSAIFISQIRYQDKLPTQRRAGSAVGVAREYIDGLKYLLAHKGVLVLAVLKGAMALSVSGGFQVIQVTIAEQVFVLGQSGGISLGLLYAVVGAGTGLGPILARWFTGDRGRDLRIAISLAYLISALGLVVVGTLANFPVVLAGTALRGVGAGVNWVFSTQLLLQTLPDHMRGRVFSTEFAFLTLMNATGATLGGWGVDHPGVEIGVLLRGMAGLTLALGLLWTLWLLFGGAPGDE
jgi:MFS family permease